MRPDRAPVSSHECLRVPIPNARPDARPGGTKLYRVANTKDPKQRLKVIFDEDDPDQLPSKQVRGSPLTPCPCRSGRNLDRNMLRARTLRLGCVPSCLRATRASSSTASSSCSSGPAPPRGHRTGASRSCWLRSSAASAKPQAACASPSRASSTAARRSCSRSVSRSRPSAAVPAHDAPLTGGPRRACS